MTYNEKRAVLLMCFMTALLIAFAIQSTNYKAGLKTCLSENIELMKDTP